MRYTDVFWGAQRWLTLPNKKHPQVGAKTDFKLLTRFLLPEGFIPPVVPEVDTVTVGGAIAGLVMESSSFRYGFLHNAVVAMEAMRYGDGMENQMVRIDMDKKKVVVCPHDFGHGMIGHDLTNA